MWRRVAERRHEKDNTTEYGSPRDLRVTFNQTSRQLHHPPLVRILKTIWTARIYTIMPWRQDETAPIPQKTRKRTHKAEARLSPCRTLSISTHSRRQYRQVSAASTSTFSDHGGRLSEIPGYRGVSCPCKFRGSLSLTTSHAPTKIRPSSPEHARSTCPQYRTTI